jgi:hypothetical protein
MDPMNADSSARSTLRALLFPETSRHFPWARPVQLLLRSVHIAAMAMILGGLPFGADFHAVRLSILLTVASGVALFAIDLAKDAAFLVQGSGVAVLLKLGLLGGGLLQPAARLPWYLVATFVAAIGSHMPGAWRHFSFLTWQVTRYPD